MTTAPVLYTRAGAGTGYVTAWRMHGIAAGGGSIHCATMQEPAS